VAFGRGRLRDLMCENSGNSESKRGGGAVTTTSVWYFCIVILVGTAMFLALIKWVWRALSN
jgi:hypothetical protein